jgi:glycosyltransferase involved in cell wall biosynthesis
MPIDSAFQLPLLHYSKPRVSIVIPTRNEHPVLFVSIFSILEELRYWGYPLEFVIVSNQDTDLTPEILEHRFRQWIEHGEMQVIRFNEKASAAVARTRGARAATGEVLLFSDAHVSYKIGTLHGLIQCWLKHGGMWHSCQQAWGDMEEIRLYGYELTLEKNFWGNQSFAVPQWARVNGHLVPYTIPMASYAGVLVGREEFWEVGGFNDGFKCYAGEEPYLSMKWWLFGKQVWLFPDGLVRHDNRGTRVQRSEDGTLSFGRRYSWTNDELWFNYLLAAYTIGGESWLERLYQEFRQQCQGVEQYLKDAEAIRESVLSVGHTDRLFIAARQHLSLDELLQQQPWNIETCIN